MNEIDELMHKPALDVTAQDIDKIVAYHRAQRAGGKAETAKAARKAKVLHDIDIPIATIAQHHLPPKEEPLALSPNPPKSTAFGFKRRI